MKYVDGKFVDGNNVYNTFLEAMGDKLIDKVKGMNFINGNRISRVKINNLTEYVTIKMFFEYNKVFIIEEEPAKVPCTLQIYNFNKIVKLRCL